MMQVEEHILWMAQTEARACTRIVQCVERIADLALASDNQVISKVSANIALEAFLIRPSNILGLSCTVHQRPSPSGASPIRDIPSHLSHGDRDSRISHGERDSGRRLDSPGESLLKFKCHTVNSSSSSSSSATNQLHKGRASTSDGDLGVSRRDHSSVMDSPALH
ncbi:hypothetical protein NL108_004697 [Boleophthalmus pectinirostris]|nr:hypothetical protein NL108_004697 [Boleophthalmus pectinirostris]